MDKILKTLAIIFQASTFGSYDPTITNWFLKKIKESLNDDDDVNGEL